MWHWDKKAVQDFLKRTWQASLQRLSDGVAVDVVGGGRRSPVILQSEACTLSQQAHRYVIHVAKILILSGHSPDERVGCGAGARVN